MWTKSYDNICEQRVMIIYVNKELWYDMWTKSYDNICEQRVMIIYVNKELW